MHPEEALAAPVAVLAVPGSPYAVAIVGAAPTTSGPAVGSVVAGIGAVLPVLRGGGPSA